MQDRPGVRNLGFTFGVKQREELNLGCPLYLMRVRKGEGEVGRVITLSDSLGNIT